MSTRIIRTTESLTPDEMGEKQRLMIFTISTSFPEYAEELKTIKAPLINGRNGGLVLDSSEMSEELKNKIRAKFKTYI